MLSLTKNYVLDQDQQPIAVQIPIAEFEQIEELLENFGLVKLMTEPDELSTADDADRLSKAEALKYYEQLKSNHVVN